MTAMEKGSRTSLGTGIDGYGVLAPAGSPGVVVIHEAFGVNPFVEATCERLAAAGYATVAPDYYHGRTYDYADRTQAIAALNEIDDAQAMRETEAGLDWLVKQGARADRLAVLGFCMGGRLAFLANATLGKRLAATVSFYGGGIAPAQPSGKRKPLLDRAADLSAPALLIYGAQDTSITADEHGRLAQALTAAGKRYQLAVFPDAGHAFATFDRESYREPASALAWALSDAFLAAELRRG